MARSNRSSEKESFWRAKLAEFEQLGLSVRQFCDGHRLAEASFYSWRREIAKRDVERASEDTGLIPVTVIDSGPLQEGQDNRDPLMELITPSGFTLKLNREVPVEWIETLLRAVEKCGVRSC